MRCEDLSYRRCLLFSAICSVLSSLSIGLIPAAQVNESGAVAVGIPIVFWVGLAGEQIFIWRANSLRKTFGKKENSCSEKLDGKPGVLPFFKSTEGTVADILLLLSMVIFIVMTRLKVGGASLQYMLICCVVLSLRLHCILNGMNYRYKKI